MLGVVLARKRLPRKQIILNSNAHTKKVFEADFRLRSAEGLAGARSVQPS